MNVEPEKIQALISILQSMLDPEQPKTKPKITKNKKISGKKTKQKNSFNNKFDSMPEINMHKEDTAVDKKLCIHPPVPRARSLELIQVSCRVCGKKENVNPSILHDSQRYKCNKCSASSG